MAVMKVLFCVYICLFELRNSLDIIGALYKHFYDGELPPSI